MLRRIAVSLLIASWVVSTIVFGVGLRRQIEETKELKAEIEAVHAESRMIDSMLAGAIIDFNERLNKFEDRHTAGHGI